LIEQLGDTGKDITSPDADSHGQEDPQGKEPVEYRQPR
jgi:hypothetical protein